MVNKIDTIISSPNTNLIDKVVDETESGAEYFLSVSDKIVYSCTEDLDNLMRDIYNNFILKDADDSEIEKCMFELSNLLYFLGDRLEKMGIKDDVSKVAYKEVYNKTYADSLAIAQRHNIKKTVAELSASAEEASKENNIMNAIYSRAYKQIKYKIDAAYEMLYSLKKVYNKRMLEMQLSMSNSGSFRMSTDIEE